MESRFGTHAYLRTQTLTPEGYVLTYKWPDHKYTEPNAIVVLKAEQEGQMGIEAQSILTPQGYWMCYSVREIPEMEGWDRAAAIAEEDAVIHRGLAQRGEIAP